ncbi:alginate export family protein, partial [Acinetobacter oleivorans]|uniref:alginate export family protein n=1 Tax=Acinetobacter oleivorans TaxID=1148157 RepID=UPI001D193341
AFDKKNISSTDQNRLDVEQAFIAWVSPLNNGTFKFRVGRQEMLFRLKQSGSLPNISDDLGNRVRTNAESILGVRFFGKDVD